MIRPFDGTSPCINDSAYIDESATIIGDVIVEADASVWPNATLRGDSGRITLHERANVQDNAVLHGNTVLKSRAAVGHGGIVHDATIGEGALVGMNAVVLDGAVVGERAIVAAGSVVLEDSEVDPEILVAGVPADKKGELSGDETDQRAPYYRNLTNRYNTGGEGSQ